MALVESAEWGWGRVEAGDGGAPGESRGCCCSLRVRQGGSMLSGNQEVGEEGCEGRDVWYGW